MWRINYDRIYVDFIIWSWWRRKEEGDEKIILFCKFIRFCEKFTNHRVF